MENVFRIDFEEHIQVRLFIALATLFFLTAAVEEPNPLIEVGADAPDWSLPANDGKTYTLSELIKDRTVVVAWYPKAFTQGCTIECKSLKDNGHLIREFEADYFMASVDTIEEVTGFAEQQEANFPLLADTSRQTAIEYGVLNPRGYANRMNVYVGTNGKVLAVDKDVNPRTAAEDIANRLAELNVPMKAKEIKPSESSKTDESSSAEG